jgi:hypothetical protein
LLRIVPGCYVGRCHSGKKFRIALRYTQDNLGVKKVSAPLKNPKKCPIICFAPDKKIISMTVKIRGVLVFYVPKRERERESESKRERRRERERREERGGRREERREKRDERREMRDERASELDNKSAGDYISKPQGQNEKSANFTGKSGTVCI